MRMTKSLETFSMVSLRCIYENALSNLLDFGETES